MRPKDGEIDLKLVAPQVDWLVGAGCHGLAAAARPARGIRSTTRNTSS